MGLASIPVQRKNFALQNGFGWTYAGLRHMDRELGYKETLLAEDFKSRFERGHIARRIVSVYPEETWFPEPELQDDPDPETDTEFESSFREMAKRLGFFSKLMRADVLANRGEFGVLLLGAGGEFDQELPRSTNGAEGLMYLQPYGQDRAVIEEIETDRTSPRYGLPRMYKISVPRKSSGRHLHTEQVLVHWSRVIHLAEGVLDNDYLGEPRLRAVWNLLDDLTKNVGGGSEATWKRADPGIHVNTPLFGPDNQPLNIEGDDDVEDQWQEYRHGLGRSIYTQGAELNLLDTAIAQFGPNAQTVLKLIAATIEVPLRKLIGSERGELASSQDAKAWNQKIGRRRSVYGEPTLEQVISRLVEYRYLPAPSNDEYAVKWPQAEEQTEQERVEQVALLAEANERQFKAEGSVIVTANEIRADRLDLEPLEESGGEEPDAEPVAAHAEGFDLTDDSAPEPEWKAIHRAADDHRASFARAITARWERAAAALDMEALEQAFEDQQQPFAVLLAQEALDAADETSLPLIASRYQAVVADGGLAALRSARSRGSFFPTSVREQPTAAATFEAEFDTTNPRALNWAENRSASLVTEIRPETMTAIRVQIAEAFRDGLAPREAAREVRKILGLRKDQLQAVRNLAAEMRAADAGTVIKRFPPREGLRTQHGFRAKVPAGGATEEWISRQTDRYTTMQRNLRARTVARTETLYASNQGQNELWKQAVDAGQLEASQKRRWLTTPDSRARDDHVEMHGQERGLDEPFESPSGSKIEPGEEPNCRCGQGLAPRNGDRNG